MITHIQAQDRVNNLQPFKAHNVSGHRHSPAQGDTLYIVMSYDWYPIWIYSTEAGCAFRNEDGYSPTTKKQMSRVLGPVNRFHERVMPRSFMETLAIYGYPYTSKLRMEGRKVA